MFEPDLAQSDQCGEKGESNSAVFDEISDTKGSYPAAIELLEAMIIDALDHREADSDRNPQGQKDVAEYVSEKHDQDNEQDQRNQESEPNQEQNLELPAVLVPTLGMGKAAPGRPN